MELRSAHILYKGNKAGELTETRAGGTRFIYDASWSQDIACALPAASREHVWPKGLHPFFEHLTAEGWLRGVQTRAVHVAQQDDFGLLVSFGADCIGAVGVTSAQPDKTVDLRDNAPAEAAAAAGRRTVSGVQKKLLAYRDGDRFQPARTLNEPATHIAKFNSPDVRTLVQNEDLTLKLAREVLGTNEVTAARIAQVANVEGIALLVERFDRRGGEKLRLEDFAQVLNKPRGANFRGKYESSYEEAASVLTTHSARSVIDIGRFFRRIVFSVLVGDADAHLKNFSLLERPEGLRLSPAYDLLNTVIYDGFDRDAALAIDGKLRPLETIDRTLLLKLGSNIGLTVAGVDRALATLGKAFSKSTVLDLAPGIDPADFRIRYAEIISNNALRLFG